MDVENHAYAVVIYTDNGTEVVPTNWLKPLGNGKYDCYFPAKYKTMAKQTLKKLIKQRQKPTVHDYILWSVKTIAITTGTPLLYVHNSF